MTHHNGTPRHPSVLHALTAAWSLRQAMERLTALANAEAARNKVEQLPAATILRSPIWGGTRRSHGDHGDPTGVAVEVDIAQAVDRRTREVWWTDRLAQATKRITWLAETLRATPGPDPVWRLINDLPRLQPGTAAVVGKHLVDEDRWVRDVVRLDPRGRDLDGSECPSCGIRPLRVHTAAPDPADWTVVCGGCVCAGQGCRCGMLVRVEGVTHIWDRTMPVGAEMFGRWVMEVAA